MLANRLVGANGYTPVVAAAYNVANASGGTGAAVTTAVSFTDQFGNPTLPGDAGQGRYTVTVTPSQACFVSVTGKTSSGFNVVLTPTLSSTSIAAGTFDILVHS
jgi:hypothetical protein